MFQLNLDGQQITQKIAGSGFGQPKFSRESIAEFQIVTNMFDITQGRSIGIQVQAVSRAGTNKMAGSYYGYFRDDKFNAPDPVAFKVLPYSNQQIGGNLRRPDRQGQAPLLRVVRIRARAGHGLLRAIVAARRELQHSAQNGQKSFLARVDDHCR